MLSATVTVSFTLSATLIIAIAVACASPFVSQGAMADRPSCEHCLSTGYAYFCKASITSQICFNKAGDAQCDHEMCVCCKAEPMGGCHACEEVDEEEGDEEQLEQTDNWQSHEMRARLDREKEDIDASRNVEIGIKGARTPEQLAAEREEKRKRDEEEVARIKAQRAAAEAEKAAQKEKGGEEDTEEAAGAGDETTVDAPTTSSGEGEQVEDKANKNEEL